MTGILRAFLVNQCLAGAAVETLLGVSIHEHNEPKSLCPSRYQLRNFSASLVNLALHIPSTAQQRQPAPPQESWPH